MPLGTPNSTLSNNITLRRNSNLNPDTFNPEDPGITKAGFNHQGITRVSIKRNLIKGSTPDRSPTTNYGMAMRKIEEEVRERGVPSPDKLPKKLRLKSTRSCTRK